jgi:SAM-dependent methyltransferase
MMSEILRDRTSVRNGTEFTPNSTDSHLLDTRQAFDSVAADYDGPLGNNALVQRMREALWRTVTLRLPKGARLLDVGCGTGIDAAYFAGCGYRVFATDWSPQMVARTRARAAEAGLSDRVNAEVIGLQELERLDGQTFDGIYSDLGPLNCVPDLQAVAHHCSKILEPGGILVVSVIGRVCPWEFLYYLARGDWERARLRGSRGFIPVNLNHRTVWTRYYTPREFFEPFAKDFELAHHRALGLYMPPPYLIRFYERHPRLFAPLAWADEHLGTLPFLREAGDHFLAVLTKLG